MPPYHYRCAGYCNIPPTTDAPKGVSHRFELILVKLKGTRTCCGHESHVARHKLTKHARLTSPRRMLAYDDSL